MRVLFVFPNEYLNNGIPTGISTLCAVLKEAGHTVKVFDYTFIKTKEPEVSKNPAIFMPTKYTLEDLVKDDPVQTLEKAFENELISFDPELICLSAMTGQFDRGIDLLQKCKTRISAKVVVGGVHPTIAPEDALAPDIVDFICVGEGEEFLLELCDAIEHNGNWYSIGNLGYRTSSGIKINPIRPFVDLDNLPTPDWAAFDIRHLFRAFMGEIYQGSFYCMSRGCPFRCSYCVNGPLKDRFKGCGTYFRYQRPETTVRHLTELKEKFNATWFKVADDSIMGFKDDYLEELRNGLKPLEIMFACSVRPETTTDHKVRLLKEMGCVGMVIGVESGSEQLRRTALNRKMTNDQIKEAVRIIKSHDIRISTFNMIGLPGETREKVFETIRFNRELDAKSCNVYVVYPYPGTDLYTSNNCSFRDADGKMISVKNASQFNLSEMLPSEVDALWKTFHLYLVLDEKLWPIIRHAENDGSVGHEIYESLVAYSEELQKKDFAP